MRLSVEELWYRSHPLRWVLWPFSLIYRMIVALRRAWLTRFCQHQFTVPIIVVGNITVGGVGKTPLVIALAKQLQLKGLRVGIVSRGYGARIKQFPHRVLSDDSAAMVGDEPLLLARRTNCPVVIAPNRVQAVQYLLDNEQSQIILSDDGLQHYSMGRAIEIVVIDGVRQLGNGLCLPAGPLREKASRLAESDILVVNSGEWPGAYPMHLQAGELTHLVSGEKVGLENLTLPVAAVAAIGHPERFFATLQSMGINMIQYSFPDHHYFCADELNFNEKTVVMTEKDAVKCQSFAADSWYFLPVEAQLGDSFWQMLWSHEQLKGYV